MFVDENYPTRVCAWETLVTLCGLIEAYFDSRGVDILDYYNWVRMWEFFDKETTG